MRALKQSGSAALIAIVAFALMGTLCCIEAPQGLSRDGHRPVLLIGVDGLK